MHKYKKFIKEVLEKSFLKKIKKFWNLPSFFLNPPTEVNFETIRSPLHFSTDTYFASYIIYLNKISCKLFKVRFRDKQTNKFRTLKVLNFA